MAIAIDQARHDPELSRKVGDYLEKQSNLVDVQIRHLDEERRLAIEAAKRKRYGDRIRNGLLTGGAVIACSVVVGFAIMVWDAAHDTGLVIESFAVPPDLAQNGMTGQVVANQLLDEIADIQISADTPMPAASYASNWVTPLRWRFLRRVYLLANSIGSYGPSSRLSRESMGRSIAHPMD